MKTRAWTLALTAVLVTASWGCAAMAAPALIRGTQGHDTLIGTSGADSIAAFAGLDEVYSGAGSDTVWLGRGASEKDPLIGDTAFGGHGHDSLWGQRGPDVLDGEQGPDQLKGGRGDDVLVATVGADSLWGGAGDDRLWGGVGGNRAYGGPGMDVITLVDDGLRDVVDCGRGADQVVFVDTRDPLDVIRKCETRVFISGPTGRALNDFRDER